MAGPDEERSWAGVAASWLTQSQFTLVFTGAGMSTESGIPDYRSPGGIWAQSQPVMYDDFLRSPESRYEYWRQKSVSHQDFAKSHPNAGHKILAQWQRRGVISGLITQNIDGLHTLAGNTHVVEIHGTARQVGCLDCTYVGDADPWVALFLEDDRVPICPDCGGRLKHATISFGQSLDQVKLDRCMEWIRVCELMIVLGSSLVVEPAASIPRLAKQNGAKLVIINRDATPQDSTADVNIRGPIGPTLQSIEAALSNND